MPAPLAAVTIALAALFAVPAPALADEGARPAPRLQSPADALPRPTDPELRTAMTGLRDLIDARLRGAATQPMTEADYVGLAADIDQRLAAISAGRDFHSRAGRHLQWVLGDIADGAALMRSAPRVPGKRMGLLRVAETLNFYGREYDHPGWAALKP